MARVDSLLSILVQQGANELRLGSDREPKMLAFGAPKRLHVPSTPDDMLRELLGEILDGERSETLRTRGRLEVGYEAAGLGTFQVRLTSRADGGFDVVFLRETGRRATGTTNGVAPGHVPSHAPALSSAPAPAPSVDPAPHVTAPAHLPPGSAPPLAAVPSHPEPLPAIASSEPLAHLVAAAHSLRASDLHLADGHVPVVRVDGTLRRIAADPVDVLATLSLGAAREELLGRDRSLDLGLEVAGVCRARVHVFRTRDGMAASVRLLPGAAPSLSSLHLPVPLDDLVDLPAGLVLVCGATGSGKSTTLAALAQEALRRRSIVLTTLEDPIEHDLAAGEASLVRRRELGRDVADFASGLRDALREDPDVILVGEMRDPATIGLALTAAETGHLVLSSLHSRSAASAIERIVDSYPAERQAQIRVQLADSLRAIVIQRLLPRVRGGGRLPCVEVLRGTHAVAALVREGRTAQIASTLQSSRREGMISLERSLADRVHAGEIRADDARAAANELASLAMYLGKSDV